MNDPAGMLFISSRRVLIITDPDQKNLSSVNRRLSYKQKLSHQQRPHLFPNLLRNPVLPCSIYNRIILGMGYAVILDPYDIRSAFHQTLHRITRFTYIQTVAETRYFSLKICRFLCCITAFPPYHCSQRGMCLLLLQTPSKMLFFS